MGNLDRAFHLVKANKNEQAEFVRKIKKDFARNPTVLTINCALPPLKVNDTDDRLVIKYFDFPSEILEFTSLKELTLQSYYSERIPDEISNLSNLEKLIINSGEYASSAQFPKFSQNSLFYDLGLKFISPTISKLTRLKVLDISDNKISSLPSEMGYLQELEILYIQNNKLNSVPYELTHLHSLKSLDIRGNPALSIPPEIVERTNEPKAILNFFFRIADEARKPLNQIKLLVVGQGSVGKTSLVQRITNDSFNLQQNKTEGIAISQWQSENPTNQTPESQIRINVWDFGGQEIMHATHQFFLTKRSLYFLVLDSRLTQEENRVEYWLKIIESFGGDSPVIIVGNKTDQHPFDIDRTGLQNKYPNIVNILDASAATGMGIPELRLEISKQLDKMPHVRDLLPKTWFDVKSHLEKLGKERNYLTHEEYLSLCTKNDIVDNLSQHTLIGFLHDLGVVIHFQDDIRLESLGILNPEWVTNGVYRIINSHALFQNKGILDLELLNDALNSTEYPSDKRMFIVDMMRKFELCFDVTPNQKYLIPDLLPKDEPFTGDWGGALGFQVHYNVLPTSIISRFIVRMNDFIFRTVWRSGVILQNGRNTALVKADTEDRKIFIWVSGVPNTRRDFLAMISGQFDIIHKSIAKIETHGMVPHPQYPDLVLDYDELIEFEKQGILDFPRKIGNQVITVDVKYLLDGVVSKITAKVFISYAHKDKDFAEKINYDLANAGIGVWKDDKNLGGGDTWVRSIATGISQSKIVLTILSPDSIESDFVEKELLYATYNAKKKIVPIRVKACQPPLILANLQYIDFYRHNYEDKFEALKKVIIDEFNKTE